MRRKDYVPTNDKELYAWIQNLMQYALENSPRWKVSAPDEDLIALAAVFYQCVIKASSPNKGKIDTLEKNENKKLLVKGIRTYVQGFIAKNPNVTLVDREKMGLPIYDTLPTPVGDPVGLVTAMIKYPQAAALELSIIHVDGTDFDKRANYGVKIACDVFASDTVLPKDGSQLRRSRFTRRKKELFTFDKEDSGKTAVFCLCYENSKGKSGQWGPMVQAVIP